jgi:threonine synthase
MHSYPQSYPLLRVENPFVLSDEDWPEISKLQRAYSCGGDKSLSSALNELLASDPVSAARVLEALSPHEMARRATDEEMLEWIRKLEILAGENDPPQSAADSRASRGYFSAAGDRRA